MIRYLVRPCWLGSVLVAATDAGIVAVLLGSDPAALVRALHVRFPDAHPDTAGDDLADLADETIRVIEAPARRFDRPLDLRGSDFERRVWSVLREIPAGQTLAYSEVAARLGVAAASREVAEACAANPVAVVVPCHRVVRKDGTLGGYRWGVARKRALLAREAAAAGVS